MPRRAERRASDRASAALDSKPGPSNRYLQALVAVTILLLSAWWAGQSLLLRASDGRCFFLLRFLFWMLLDGAFSENCAAALLLPARYIARRIPGASHTMPPPHDEAALAEQEAQKHDTTLEWPPSDAKLPAEWKQLTQQQRKASSQPFFLNHVRGHVRCRQAGLRLGAAAGTVAQMASLAILLDHRNFADAFLLRGASMHDLAFGLLTGTACVVAIFVTELKRRWIVVIGVLEVAATGEWISLNLLCDAIFHVGVAINEELSLRGWLLYNMSAWFVVQWEFSVLSATLIAIGAQSLLFAAAHAASPGASAVGLFNLTVGGVAGALNVVLTGNLVFALGWHFSWNMMMGHVLGLSTSGIPMSAKIVSIVPHPAKAALHGGRFGPEQSPLAPLAYALGVVMLAAFYGTSGMDEWEQKLKGDGLLQAAVQPVLPATHT